MNVGEMGNERRSGRGGRKREKVRVSEGGERERKTEREREGMKKFVRVNSLNREQDGLIHSHPSYPPMYKS